MDRLKTFLWYVILIALIYLFTDFVTFHFITNSYKNIDSYERIASSPEIILNEAKATAANGYVNGQIKNTTNSLINRTALKIDFYSDGAYMGTNYVKIDNFKRNQTIEFNVTFRYKHIDHIKLGFTDEDVDAQIAKQAEEIKQTVNKWLPFAGVGALIALYFI
ncbi:MAG: FxLYD domain-containing protein [Lachnospiraceae bacterium]|jgi:hypothetical protein|nr:FxLYD domain-containing protein [Lachnospiraceae bacterium]